MDTPIITEKKCYRCKVLKPIEEFYIRKDTNKRRGECAKCYSKRNNERFREYHINYYRNYRKNNKEYLKISYDYRHSNPEKVLLGSAKSRAKRNNLEFNIELSDIIIPEFCPILGLKLEMATGKGPTDNSPSLDRINNDLGYIKGNVRVISFRANSLRKDGTLEEFEKIINDIKKNLPDNQDW